MSEQDEKWERVSFTQFQGHTEAVLQESDADRINWKDVRTLPWERQDNGEIIVFYSSTVQLKYCPKEPEKGIAS